jgi:integrase
MSSVFLKRGKFWCRLKGDKVPGKWSNAPTGETDRAKAEKFATLAQQAIDKRNKVRTAGADTLRAFVQTWLVRRNEAGHDWKKDRGRLAKHVLPVIGDLALSDVTTAHVADIVHVLRFKKKLAGRTTRNVYSVLAAVLRDAAIAGKIPLSPCILTDQQLGPIIDKDPEWRDGALFTREEAAHMMADLRIPLDRRVVYALGLLAGLRPGEMAALRWRHYDDARRPLGCLTVALSYSTSRSQTKRTKTESVRRVPVHPSLAGMLEQWRAGWETMHDREPGPEDLIVPLPPEVKRTSRKGERFRGWDYTGKKWREHDEIALGWRHRSVYDTKSTFITLAIEDGADPAIIRDRVTHTKPRRDAIDGYDRGPHWEATCREVARLKLAPTLHPHLVSSSVTTGSGGGFRMSKPAISGNPEERIVDGEQQGIRTACDLGLALMGARVCTHATVDESEPLAAPRGG